ncbi:AMP-binding enzyme [Periconia macrospinosa]|uniref:AMP-binding enzyme n=1 Tax=Periconia macrospinosa TaxID=97972 RepID=A0A2V1E592_9PLEO|nr:AMP-binding enzyme [Periconia macrospinosa]
MDFVSWVLQDVSYNKHKHLIIDASNTDRKLSFQELAQQVRQLIAGLKYVGVRPGDCVCVNAFNDISYTVLYLGIIGAGAIFSGINPGYSVPEISRHIDLVRGNFMIAEPQVLEKSRAAAVSCGLASSAIFALDVHDICTHQGIRSWTVLFQYGESGPFTPSDPDTTTASYQTSSGTSGFPKAAMISHSYLIDQARLQIHQTPSSYEPIRLTALPPMHVFATPIIPASIRSGIPTYVMRRYDLSEFIKTIEKYKISETWLPPPPVIAIPKSKPASKASLESLRRISFGGGMVTYKNQLQLYELLHEDARINAVWGMTEVGWVTTVSYPNKQVDDSVGKVLDGYRLRVVDDDGKVLYDANSTGELQILAPHPMLGYLNNTEASRDTISVDTEGRWVNSGDVGHINESGNVFIVDRKKDLIKVRGWQVSPAEVESRLQQHVDVLDVGVIGVPLGDGEGELVRAYVVRQCDSLVTADELKKFSLGALARYKCPQEIVFIENIPRNPTGKILRRVLREQSILKQHNLPSGKQKSPPGDAALVGNLTWMMKAQKWWSWVLSAVKHIIRI